jgi:hypothetical protein
VVVLVIGAGFFVEAYPAFKNGVLSWGKFPEITESLKVVAAAPGSKPGSI